MNLMFLWTLQILRILHCKNVKRATWATWGWWKDYGKHGKITWGGKCNDFVESSWNCTEVGFVGFVPSSLTTSINLPYLAILYENSFAALWTLLKHSCLKFISMIPVLPGPCRAGAEVSKIGNGYKKSMAYRTVLEMQKPWAVEVVRCTSEWGNGGWDATGVTKAPCPTQWMNQWTSEGMKQ